MVFYRGSIAFCVEGVSYTVNEYRAGSMLFQRPPGVVFCIKRACTASVDETVIAIIPRDSIADKVPAIFSAFYVDSFAGIRVSCNNHLVFHDFLPFLRPICYNRGSGGAVSRYPVFMSFLLCPRCSQHRGFFYFRRSLILLTASSLLSDISTIVMIAFIITSVTVCISFSILRSFLSLGCFPCCDYIMLYA